MANSYDEPGWSDEPAQPDHSREPLFWLFLVLAAVVAVLAVTSLSDDTTRASFAGTNEPAASGDDGSALAPLPTAQPTPTPVDVPATVEVRYAVDGIEVVGSVPAQAVADALVAASAQLVGQSAVRVSLEVVPESSLSGGAVVITGEIDDEADRRQVLDAYANVGLIIDDRLIIAGSNLTIAELLAGEPSLSQMTDFLNAAGVLSQLEVESDEGLTIFVPTNEAVTSLDTIALDELSDATELTGVLEYHLVAGTITSRELAAVTALTSLQGESIQVEPSGDGAFLVGGALVITEDIDATNGVVHVVNAVLLPGTLRTEVALNALVTLDPILFASGSAQILEASFPILDSAVDILKNNRAGRVEIQGHTDSAGPAEVNLDLSQRRADSVRDYIVAEGINEQRLNATGYGETQLEIDPEESDEDRAANRRIEFRVN